MSDPEHFLARWSRRKHAAADGVEVTEPAAAEAAKDAPERSLPSDPAPQRADATPDGPKPPAPEEVAPPSPAFDIAQLPSLDSITAETDIRAFLAPGVPAELTRAALRRVWAADPKIRDFVGLAENAWDFTAPGGAPGFGPLEMTDELREMVANMVGRSLKTAEPEPPAATGSAGQTASVPIDISGEFSAPAPAMAKVEPASLQDENVNNDCKFRNCDEKTWPEQETIAVQQSCPKAEDQPAIVSRSHGRALPK